MEILPSIASFGSAVLSGGLALAVLMRAPRALVNRVFAAGLLLLALEALCTGLAIGATTTAELVFWQRARYFIRALLPSVWLVFSLVYSRGNRDAFLKRWRPALLLVFIFPAVLAIAFHSRLVMSLESWAELASGYMKLGWAGSTINVVFLLSCVLVLVNLERTFSASVGTMRWRLKFNVLGLALLFAVRIYTCSQALLYNAVNLSLMIVDSLALGLACLLVGFSLVRSQLSEVEIYPSQAVLHRSFTVVLAGLYLLVVGVFAKVVATWGGGAAFPLKAFVVLAAIAGVGVLLLSDRLRQRLRLFVSRHFNRPFYDYRKIWSEFTERTTSLMNRIELSRAVAKLLSETFGSLSVTVWLLDEQTSRLAFAASTSLAEEEARNLSKKYAASESLLKVLREHPHPVDIDSGREEWLLELQKWNPDFFKKGGNRVCVPMVSGGELLGLVTLADRVSGVRFSFADMDLLKCMGDQGAASLRNIQLSERLQRAREMEAFQTMSTFLVHDLKNLAYTLSLMLQNMSQHFGDPAFREDALRSLSRSVNHLKELIGRFNLLREGLQLNRVDTDLNVVVRAALESVGRLPGVHLAEEFAPLPKLRLDPEQLQKVVTNLVLNAKDAIGPQGEIHIRTSQRNGWVLLAITDTGAGMSSDFMEHSLFKPFQTTKKNGLGIGMFHSKMIVEAHQGKMEVESELGKGTTFRVLFPLGER